MNREKKTGVVLIIIGICLPLIFLPFLSGYEKDKGIIENFLKIGIVIKKEKPVSVDTIGPSSTMKILPTRFPFRFILAFGIFLIFSGFVKIDLIKRRDIDHKQ
jgi:hypothetical protein